MAKKKITKDRLKWENLPEEEKYRRQLKFTHFTPEDVSKVGRTVVDCYCIKCGCRCSENDKECPNCKGDIRCYKSNI